MGPRRSERKRRHYTEAPAADGEERPAKADKSGDSGGQEKDDGGAVAAVDGGKKDENGAAGEEPPCRWFVVAGARPSRTIEKVFF